MLERQHCAAMVIGGPTTVLDLGGLRIVADPTFDGPGPHGPVAKTAGPAVAEDELGTVDLVLISHDQHPDNLDDRGRAFALASPLILTGPLTAARLGAPAVGLPVWTGHRVPRPDGGGDLEVLAVPAVHGPADAPRDADGNILCEVTGFVLSGEGLPTVYVSGDNASLGTVAEIARRAPAIDAAVLFGGSARVEMLFQGRPLTLDGSGVCAAAVMLGAPVVIAAHHDGWAHFSSSHADIERAFHDAGLSSLLRSGAHGSWIPLTG
ncbi:MBL fold metallo-hydrolase [Actinomadura macra]|uniref:MBL fold metallo-hydrolase n=1 Tax=Actinomadura macra TaxID=46164 RepID=UPI000A5CD36B|nr:MBL fold metallo-hydrolase [Actinomadura macra]